MADSPPTLALSPEQLVGPSLPPPTWSIVWLAPVSRSSAGRSAVSMSSGTLDCAASTTAGSKFATAVPEDVTTTASGQEMTTVAGVPWCLPGEGLPLFCDKKAFP